MQRMKKVATGMMVTMLSAWLPSFAAFAQPVPTAGKKFKAAIVERISAKPATTVVRPQQNPSVVVKRVWIGGPPWLGGHEATLVEKAPETRQVQTGRVQAQTQPRRVWVGGAPWLGGYETWVTPK